MPGKIVRDPDPATYDADAAFRSGQPPTFNSPDINTVNIWPVSPIGEISATVRNLSLDAAAQRTRVDLSWTPFGIGLQRTPIFSTFVDLARAGLGGSQRKLSWPTPAALMAGGPFGIFVDVHHPYDRDAGNNRGQQIVDGMQTSAGRSKSFVFPVRNAASEPRTISLSAAPAPHSGWATISPAAVTLGPGAQQNVTVTVKVPAGETPSPPGTQISATVDVVAQSGGTLVGGVSILILLDS